MAKAALFVGWGTLIPGREKVAREVLKSAIAYCAKLRQTGEIDSFEPVTLEPHGGDLEGFVLVKGTREALARVRDDPEFMRMIAGLRLVHHSVGVVGAYTGDEMQALMEVRAEQLEKLF